MEDLNIDKLIKSVLEGAAFSSAFGTDYNDSGCAPLSATSTVVIAAIAMLRVYLRSSKRCLNFSLQFHGMGAKIPKSALTKCTQRMLSNFFQMQ